MSTTMNMEKTVLAAAMITSMNTTMSMEETALAAAMTTSMSTTMNMHTTTRTKYSPAGAERQFANTLPMKLKRF